MALSGSASTTFNSGHHKMIMEWSATQSIPSNNSTVTMKIFLQSLDSYGAFYGSTSNAGSTTVNGVTKTWTANSTLSANQKKELYRSAWTIGHNSDGTKSFTFSNSFTVNITYSGTYIGAIITNGSGTLNTIPRTSSVSLSSSTISFGGSTNVNISRASSSFTHTVYFNFGSDTQTIATKTGSTTISFTPKLSFANQISTNTTGWGTIYCETYSGSTKIGTSTTKLVLNTTNDSTFKPKITLVSLTETVPEIGTAIGAVWLQSKSRINIKTDSTTLYGATVKSVSVKIGNNISLLGQSVNSGSILETGTLTLAVTLTDTRGYTDSYSTTIEVIPYSNPVANSLKVTRDTANQDTVTVEYTGTTTPVNGLNDMGFAIDYKVSTSQSWTTVLSKTDATTKTWTGNLTLPDSTNTDYFDIDKSYNFRLRVWDEMLTDTASVIVPVASVPMSWGTNGSAVGTVFQEGGAILQVKKSISIDGVNLIDKFYPVGTIYESVNSANPSTFIGGTWERFGNGRVLVGVDETDSAITSSGLEFGSTNPLTAHSHSSSKGQFVVAVSAKAWASGATPTASYAEDTATATSSAGSNTGHANWQPSISVYRFKRIS